MKNPFFPLLLLFTSATLLAQAPVEGYLVTTRHDTLRGFIMDEGWTKEPEEVKIQLSGADAGNIRTVPADEILTFSTGSTRFIRLETKVLKPVTDIRLLPSSPEASFTAPAPHLLRVLIEGKLSLLYLKNASGEHLFVAKGDSLSELYALEYMSYDQATKMQVVSTFRQYRKTLAGYVLDCPQLIARLEGLSLGRKSIAAFVREYNSLCAGGVVFEEVAPKSRLFLSGFAGAGMGTMNFRSGFNYWYYLTSVNRRSFEPMAQAGVRLQIAPPGHDYRWRFQAEAFFTNDLAVFDGQYSSPGYQEWAYNSRIQVSSLATCLGFGYYHPVKGAFRPYGSLGTSLLFNRYAANWYTNTVTYTGEAPKTTQDVAIARLSRKNMGTLITVGVQYKRHVFAELRYLNTDGPSDLANLSGRRKSLVLALGYQL